MFISNGTSGLTANDNKPGYNGSRIMLLQNKQVLKSKKKSTSSYTPCRVTFLEQGLAQAGRASCWASAHPYTLVLRRAWFWPAGATVWPAGTALPRHVTFRLGKQFLSMPTPAVALLEDLKFSPSNQCSERETPWQNPSLLWEEGTGEQTGYGYNCR